MAPVARMKQTDNENTEETPAQRKLGAQGPHEARHFILCGLRTDTFLVIVLGPNQCRRFFDLKKIMSLVIKSQRYLVSLDSDVEYKST